MKYAHTWILTRKQHTHCVQPRKKLKKLLKRIPTVHCKRNCSKTAVTPLTAQSTRYAQAIWSHFMLASLS